MFSIEVIMFFANNEAGRRTKARYAKSGEKYFCPLCGKEVILKDADTKNAHYAHKGRTHCENDNSDRKTSWHRRMQNHFSDRYQEIVVNQYGEEHMADIVKDGVVIKFVDDDISHEEFMNLTSFFMSFEFRVVWIFDISNSGYKTIARYAHPEYDKGAITAKAREAWEIINSYLEPDPDGFGPNIALFLVYRENNQDHFKRVVRFCYNEEGIFTPEEFVIVRGEYDFASNMDPNELFSLKPNPKP